MENNKYYREVIEGAAKQQAGVLDNSDQSMYIYMNDLHKVCNKNFAKLLGYSSPEEWASVTDNFPDAFVAKGSQETLVRAYQEAMENFVGSTISVTWRKKNGGEVKTTTILVQIMFESHPLALHFISKA